MGIAAQRQAAKIFGLDEFALAVMRYSRCVNIIGLGALNRAVGRCRRWRSCGLFGRCSSRLSVHLCSVVKRLRADPAQLSSQASVTPPKRICLYYFYAISRVKRPIEGVGPAILSQSLPVVPPTGALGETGSGSDPLRISAVRRADTKRVTRCSLRRSIAARSREHRGCATRAACSLPCARARHKDAHALILNSPVAFA